MSESGPLAVGDRVRRRRGRPAPGTVVRIVRNEPHQVVEVAWEHLAHPFDRALLPASQLKRLPTEQQTLNAQHLTVGDRVERRRLVTKSNTARGTVTRIIQTNPQIVAVSWDSAPRAVTPERSERLRRIGDEQNPEHQR